MDDMKNKLLYYLLNIATLLFSFSFLIFLILAFVMRAQGKNFAVMFCLAGVSALFGIISLIIYVKIIKTEWYKEVLGATRLEKFKKAKSKRLKVYGLEKSSSVKHFGQILGGFQSINLSQGEIFFREGINIYNKKKPSIDVFYLPKDFVNSFDMATEKGRIKSIADDIDIFLKARNLNTDFLNCVILFYHDTIEEKEKEFYYNFTGLWESEIEKGKLIKNRFFTYCGLELSSGYAYFYKVLSSDEGAEVDLSYLIIHELKLKEIESE